MTPPNREAMVYDLEVLKSLGVNMVRKHVSLTSGTTAREPHPEILT